jgi:phage tail sheath protein FI
MISNFLIQQWKTGAHAGSKQGDAFYVKAGLNETMSSLDTLEGRIII